MINIITIDGPSGAGKGTVAKIVAKKLGFHLLDSGALYRIVALAVSQLKLNIDDEQTIANLIDRLDIEFTEGGIWLNKQIVSSLIRQENIGNLASHIAKFSLVRQSLLEKQHNFAQKPGLVADGRDMGTIVFPSASLKIFLTASADERASRRYKQLIKDKQHVDFNHVLADIIKRDELDINRSTAPLAPASDAIIIDSTNLKIMQVVELIMDKALKYCIF